ncbi:ATP-binding protein [Acuticoccus sp.]|uniref:ATP-binding protein n=1 Tax=Acuticoccus sp. TaxID=1904378 RepID=UPI003B5236EF
MAWGVVALACVMTAAFTVASAAAAAIAIALAALAALVAARPARAEDVVEVTGEVEAPLSEDARAVLDAAPDACVILASDGTILWVNRAAREQLGLFTVGRPISFALRVPELVRAVEVASRSGTQERARWSEKVPTSRWFEAVISPLALAPSADGDAGAALAVFVRDLTEQQRLDRMREDFVANASHELRTPLAALTGIIETLQGPARDDAPARTKFLEVMREQAERMKRLTDALLSLSRIEMRAHVRPTDVVDCVERVRYAAEMVRPVAAMAQVALELDLPGEPLGVRGDADELVQVFDNLIENAVKYGGEGGRVRVSVRREDAAAGPVVAISVEDYGRGIPPEHVPRLTERFYRVDVEEARARRGTGLGLAIVKHILARHRGRLTVRSQLGAGSTFTVRLPLHLGPPA